jgi:hypothetical protein
MSVHSIVVTTDSLTKLTSSGITFISNFAKMGELFKNILSLRRSTHRCHDGLQYLLCSLGKQAGTVQTDSWISNVAGYNNKHDENTFTNYGDAHVITH